MHHPPAEESPRQKRGWFCRGCACGGGRETDEPEPAVDLHENLAPTTTSESRSAFLGTVGVASQSEQYRGTLPMHIPDAAIRDDARRNIHSAKAGVSLGVDVNYMAPTPRPVNSAVIDRANEASSDDFGSARGKNKSDRTRKGTDDKPRNTRKEKAVQVGPNEDAPSRRATSTASDALSGTVSPDQTDVGAESGVRPPRPLLDEAISWERLAGLGQKNKKTKWWHMP